MKNHSRHLHSPLCAIFAPHSVNVARYASLIQHKSPQGAFGVPQIVEYICQKTFSKPTLYFDTQKNSPKNIKPHARPSVRYISIHRKCRLIPLNKGLTGGVRYISIHRKCRGALPLSKRFTGVFSAGEIHCLRRLRKEGSPDFLSRSWQLVRRNVARFV